MNSKYRMAWAIPAPTSEALNDMRVILQEILWSASVYPLLVKYPHRTREESIGQGPSRPSLRARRPQAHDPRGLRARDAPRAPVQRDGRLLGDADFGTSSLRGRRHPDRPPPPRPRPR